MKNTQPRIAKNGKKSAAKKQRFSERALITVINNGLRALPEDDFEEMMNRICAKSSCGGHEEYIASAVLEKMRREDDENDADKLLVEAMRKGDAVKAAGSKVQSLLKLMLAEHRLMEINLRLPPSTTCIGVASFKDDVQFCLKNSLAELQDVVQRVTVLYSGMLARVNESARAQG